MDDDDNDYHDADDKCGTVLGMNARGNRSTQRKPTTVSLCPPQIPHDLTLARIRAIVVGSRRLTACATARPLIVVSRCMKRLFRCQIIEGRRSAGTPSILTQVFCGVLQSPYENSGVIPLLGHGHFLLNYSQLIIHQLSYRQPSIDQPTFILSPSPK
jgi:hypothetical protein